MALKDFRGAAALDLLENILDPAQAIFSDQEAVENLKSGKSIFMKAKALLKTHKKDVLEILAAVAGVPVEEYRDNIFDMLKKVMDLINDPDVRILFQSQGQTGTSSGSATESTRGHED